MDPSELSTEPWTVDASDYPADGSLEDRIRFLLRYAILAPSSHNSQPWSFAVDGPTVDVHAERSRWLEVADDDRRELHLSLGCAVENLLVAAGHFGLGTTVEYHERPDGGGGWDGAVVSVRFDPDGPADQGDAALFEAVTERRTAHGAFEDRPVPESTLDRLRGLVREPGVDLLEVEDGPARRRLAELQAEADERQMDDPAYRRELGRWIGTGALGASWLAARLEQVVVRILDLGAREGRKNSRLVESAPVVALLATDGDAVTDRVRAGRIFERLALAATLEDVAVHPMSQILERPESKAELASLLDLGERTPQHLFRMGFAAVERESGRTPRWPVETVTR